ncbi:2OG-Fe(II) oxygenase [Pseudomonadota bacterium]|nr:2OG-Fe(II) oxygenase [Pseudomonadota bacterium]
MINNKYKDLNKYIDEFNTSKPFPHLILDNFFTKNFFEELCFELSHKSKKILGKEFSTSVEKNKIINLNNELPQTINKILKKLTTKVWINNLINLTGISDLTADGGHNEVLSNFHEMSKSGFLGSHVDHSHHPTSNKKHVLNIILYLSKDWKSDFGGNTLLFNKYGSKVEKFVEYIPNRLLIFLHTPYSFHGVDELKPNKNQVRKTLYLDFYSEHENPYSHLSLPFKNHFFKHGTTFVLNKKLSYLKPENFYYTKTLLRYNFNKYK